MHCWMSTFPLYSVIVDIILNDQITPRFAMLLFRNYDDIFLTFPNTQVYVDAEPVTETVK